MSMMFGNLFVVMEIGNTAFAKNDDPDKSHSVRLCTHLIEEAKRGGANAVKLQKRTPRRLFAKRLFDAPYLGENSFGSTYGLHREALEFDENQWKIIVNYAKSKEIILFSTVFDEEAADFAHTLDLPLYKIASGCLKDIPLIKYVASFGKPMIVSCGGCSWEDIDRAYAVLCDAGVEFALLHCVMQYPCLPAHVNLAAITEMRRRYSKAVIGFSDHTIGTWAIYAAYGFGARVFEKHFTSNKALPGTDHALSIEPHELKEMMHTLERIQAAEGLGEKQLFPWEQDGYYKMGKGIYAARPIAAMQVISKSDVAVKSPAVGIEPWRIDQVVGRRVVRDIAADEPINDSDLLSPDHYSTAV